MGKRLGQWVIPACGLILIVSAVACSGERRDQISDETRTSSSVPAERHDGERRDVTLVGCLQQGDGRNDFILTEDNTARDITGTSGSAPSAEQQRLRAAAKSYRLTDADQDLHEYVGKQVRVIGTLDQPSDIPTTHGTAGSEPEKIRERDLAKVDVGRVETVAESCGSSKGAKRQ